MRRENNEAHGRVIQQLDRIASTVEHIDEQVDEIAEWQGEHEAFHERIEARWV
jgi:prefoldin subunit 5